MLMLVWHKYYKDIKGGLGLKVISGIIEQHGIGANCGTNATRVALRYLGYDFTEEMVFGLGSGLGFIYQYFTEEDSYFVSGKNESLENNVCSLLGGQCISGFWDDNNVAWDNLKKFIDNDIPVIVDTSIKELPYFKEYMESLFNIGFGLHNVLVAGYDEKEKTVLLLDHRWTKPQVVSMKDFEKARSTKNTTIEPRNGYKVLLPAQPGWSRLDKDIETAIQLNINRIRYPYAFKMGLKGMKMFQKDVIKFYSNIEENRKHIVVFGSLLEKLGTGGGNYRRMYGNFLKEAGKEMRNEKLIKIGTEYMRVANVWKKLSNMFLSAKESDLTEIESMLDELVIKENVLIEQLEESIK